ncbi:MAG: reverse transcriptase domain-containing protein [Verrucomicrobiota bacterium]
MTATRLTDLAFEEVTRRRKRASPNDSVWSLRFRWPQLRPQVTKALRTGIHYFEPVEIFRRSPDTEFLEKWTALDAVILKAVSLFLTPLLGQRVSTRCFHLKGRGGAKGAVRELHTALLIGRYHFVFRSDVYHYYESMNHAELLHALSRLVPHPPLIRLVSSFLDRTIYRDGHYRAVGSYGIGRGSPLSPLLGAVYLAEMDEKLSALAEKHGLFYARFMDDWVILSPTRWKLKKAIRLTNQCLEQVQMRQHPDKTFIGRVERGFDFLGYQFGEDGLAGLSRRSLGNVLRNLSHRIASGASREALEQYLRRWNGWAKGGLGQLAGRPDDQIRSIKRASQKREIIQLSGSTWCGKCSNCKRASVLILNEIKRLTNRDWNRDYETVYDEPIDSRKPSRAQLAEEREEPDFSQENRHRLNEQGHRRVVGGRTEESIAGSLSPGFHRREHTVELFGADHLCRGGRGECGV